MHAKSHGWAERAQTYGDILYVLLTDGCVAFQTTSPCLPR